jgi:SAM-dependent methyltransferase
LPFPRESFDVIVSIETIEHLRNQNAFLEDCRRVLRHGGKILVSTPNRLLASPQSETPLCPYHTREFTVDDFRELLNSYFCKVTIYGMFAFGKLELLKRKLEVTASAKIPFLSRQHRRFRRLITNFGLSDYSLISLNQVRSLEDLWDHRFEPYVILDGQTFSMPETIIGVGEKPDLP